MKEYSDNLHKHDDVIYVEKTNFQKELKSEHANFKIGKVISQEQGADISHHGSPMYDTETKLQLADNQVYTHHEFANDHYHPLSFIVAESLEDVCNDTITEVKAEIADLNRAIQEKIKELTNLQNNHDEIRKNLPNEKQSKSLSDKHILIYSENKKCEEHHLYEELGRVPSSTDFRVAFMEGEKRNILPSEISISHQYITVDELQSLKKDARNYFKDKFDEMIVQYQNNMDNIDKNVSLLTNDVNQKLNLSRGEDSYQYFQTGIKKQKEIAIAKDAAKNHSLQKVSKKEELSK